MAERWTKERRVEHTRILLVDAAEKLFAHKGFDGSSLEDIADAAGYTRGAIYAHFGSKAELFLAVTERQRQQFLDGFADLVTSFQRLDDLDIDGLAGRWRDLIATGGADRAALSYEFTLFLLRNPDARDRVAQQRIDTAHALADYITSGVERLGGTLRIPALGLARVVLAANDGVTLSSLLDDEAIYRTFLQLVVSSIAPPD